MAVKRYINDEWITISGLQGPTGAAGASGAAGETGPTGATGATGSAGPANTLTIGTVTNGSVADASITGTSPNQTLNLVLPLNANAVTLNEVQTLTNKTIAGSSNTFSNIPLSSISGITATTSEVNILNGVTASTAEVNFLDGVTSNIQTQIDSKLSTSSAASIYAPTLDPSFSGTVNIAGSTTSSASMVVGSGTLMTSPVAGGFEFDGKNFYLTSSVNNRTVLPSESIIFLSSSRSLSSVTTDQNIFNLSFTALESTSYFFEGVVNLTTGTTSNTVSFGFTGTATYTSANRFSTFLNVADNGTPTAATSKYSNSEAVAVISPASTVAGKTFTVRGILRINAGGTVIPTLKFSAAPGGTNTVDADSFFRIVEIGTNTSTTFGPWS